MKNLKLVAVAVAMGLANAAIAQDNGVVSTPQVTQEAVQTEKPVSNTMQAPQDVQTKEQAMKVRSINNENATKQTASIDKICKLKDDQKVKVYQIYLDSYTDVANAKRVAGTDIAKANDSVKKIETERMKKIESTLNDSQKKLLQNAVKANHGKPIDVITSSK